MHNTENVDRATWSLRTFYRRWFVFGHSAQLLAALLCMWAPVQAQYQPDANGNPVWNSPDPEPSEGPDYSDGDGDYLAGWYESFLGTNPYSPDTDGDLITDYDEVFVTGTNPLDSDTNDNGYTDLEDYLITSNPSGDFDSDGIINADDPYPRDHTNWSTVNNIAWYGNVLGDEDQDGTPNWNDPDPYPSASDVDGDGIENSLDPFPNDYTNYSAINNTAWYGAVLQDNDGDLLLNWEDPVPDDPDQDGDGLYLSQETALGTSDTDVDSDDDGLTDYEEVMVYQSAGVSPTNAHSLSSQYTDWYMVDTSDWDGGGIPNRIEQYYGLNPNDPWDDIEGDLDGDGVSNLSAYQQGLHLGAQYASRYDRDYDGMTDVWEISKGFDINDPQDACDDSDGDYLFNVEEYLHNTDPGTADSDLNPANGDDFQYVFQVASASLGLNQTDVGSDGREYNDDWDGDGHDNRVEVLAGSDPRDGDSLPVNSTPPSGSAPAIGWPGNGSGSNSGAGSTPGSGPTDLPVGLPVDKSFYHFQDPKRLESDEDPVTQPFVEWRRGWASYSTTDFDPGETFSSYYAWNSDDEEMESSSSAIPLAVGADWKWLGSDLWGVLGEIRAAAEHYYTVVDIPEEGVQDTTESWRRYSYVHRIAVFPGHEVPYWRYYKARKVKYTAGGSRVVLGIVNLDLPPDATESVETSFEGGDPYSLARNQSESVAYEVLSNGDAPPGFTISASDAAGPGYRKVGLNGAPLADGKPQDQDESGERAEETFVDAFTRQLNHSVSDVYASVESSLLPLAVRRDVSPEAWSLRSGLRPSERADKPFGAGWSSNICSFVRLQNSRKASVIDEQGATCNFVWDSDSDGWIHTREEKQTAKSSGSKLEYVRDEDGIIIGFIFSKKFGTTCHYSFCNLEQYTSNDRLRGSYESTTLEYARLTKVVDRWGNELCYDYNDDETTLIPWRIYDPDRPDYRVSITQNDGRVTAVKGPAGDVTSYQYEAMGQEEDEVYVLTSVTRGGHTVRYTYEVVLEPTPAQNVDPNGPPDPAHRHVSLSTLKDERNNVYSFTYEFNHACKYVDVSGDGTRVRVQVGMPRLVASVTIPGGAQTVYTGVRDLETNETGGLVQAIVNTTASGPCGVYQYRFNEPQVYRPVAPDPDDPSPESLHLTVYFTEMEVQSAVGTETYEFSFDHAMALTSAQDVSGNTTEFFYEAPGDGLGWDDPIQQRNAMGQSKFYSYDSDTRVLESVTDERGTRTEYTIQPDTGLRTQERVMPPGLAPALRVTDFDYGDPTFAGFLTRRTVQSNTSAIGDMVTEYESDGNGRVRNEVVRAGGGLELITSYTYLGNGSKQTVKDPKGYTTTFEYEAGTLRLKKVIHPDNTFKEFSYDAHGNVLWEQNEEGTKTFHEYDDLNRRIKSTVDLNGNEVANARQTTGGSFLTGTSLVPGYSGDLVVETTYNAFNLPVAVKDARGVTTLHGYDTIGRRTSTTVNSTAASNADKLVTTYSYSGSNSGGSIFDVSGFKPTSTTDPRGFVTTVTYDDLYRPTATTLVDTTHSPNQVLTTETDYDSVGNVVSVEDPLGRVTTTEYDGLNRPTEVHLPEGPGVPAASRQTFYTSAGQVRKTIDELGRDTLSFYDNAGRLIRVEAPVVDDGGGNLVRPVTRTAYDANGNVRAVEDALGRITETEYDNRNRPVEVTLPYVADALSGTWQRPVTTTEYDDMGRAIRVTDPLGKVTETGYDRAGRATGVKRPAVEVFGQSVQATYTRTKYDAGGLVLETLDARGRSVVNQYHALGWLTRTYDAMGYQTNFKHDKGGNRTEVKDANSRVTEFVYDAQNRVLSETSVLPPLAGGNQTTSFGYDKVNKTSRTDALGRQTTYAYDVRNRLSTVTYVGGSQGIRTYAYDAAGQLLGVTESAQPAAHVSYTYDALGRVSSEVSRGFTHEYTYDLAGNRIATAYGTGRSETRAFDALNRPVSITEGGRTTSYYYDLGGRAVGQLSGNGQWGTSHYDAQGRLMRRTLRQGVGGGSPALAELAFHYDAVGNLRQQEEWWPGKGTRSGVRSTLLAYDSNDRLRQELVNEGTNQTTTNYSYDSVGNRTSKGVYHNGALQKTAGYVTNARNQLISWSEYDGSGVLQRSAAMTYDAAGNRITQNITPAGGSAQTTTYTWDYDNRLTSVTLPGSNVHSYAYDYRTRRITRSEPGENPVAMTFSGGLSVAEFEVTDPVLGTLNALPDVEYQRGPDMGGGVGGLLYSLRSGTAKFNLSNGRGDVVAQSDTSGSLTWTASYEAYGKRPVETGSNADRQRANTKEEDPTGLLNEGFRYRDLETGVWLSKDPAGFVDGPNLYAYVRQNPWSKFDPDGLKPVTAGEALRIHAEQRAHIERDYAERSLVEQVVSDIFGVHAWMHRANNQALENALAAGNYEVRKDIQDEMMVEQAAKQASISAVIVTTAGATVDALTKPDIPVPPEAPVSPEASPEKTKRDVLRENQENGYRRETTVQEELEHENPGKVVQRERLLRDSDGKKAVDPVTGEGRRLDHVVIDRENNSAKPFETTGPDVDKKLQLEKEQRIREQGGTYVRDKETRKLVPVDGISEVRRKE